MMGLERVIVLALMLSIETAWSSHLFNSTTRNQYRAREIQPPHSTTLDRLSRATDQPPKDRLSQHHADPAAHQFFTNPKTIADKHHAGFKTANETETLKNHVEKRRRRSFQPWSSPNAYEPVPYPSLSVWRPSYAYAIHRPYFIPVYGIQSGIKIYLPPQPLLLNPGQPQVNKKPPYQGPMYLPPPPAASTTTESPTTMPFDDRYNTFESNPIWDDGDSAATTTTTVRPTRRTTQRGQTSTHPPIVRPAAPENEGQRPLQMAAATTTIAPRPPPQQQPPRRGPTICAWAILSCCTPSGQADANCFEARGCGSLFFDSNPCNSDFAQSAIDSALNYYENNRKRK